MTTLTTVNVTISLRRVINQPLPGGRAEFTLTRQDYDGAIAVPVTTEIFALPPDGTDVVAPLWPNVRGTQGSQYQVTIKDQAGVVQASGLATIPATDCSLAAVLYTSAPPQVPVYPAAQPTLGQVLVGGASGIYTPTTLGTNKQLLFNDGGTPAGDAGLAYDKATGAITVGGKTVTASAPVLQGTQTWNNAGVTFAGALVNVTDQASAAASRLLDLQVGGVSKFAVQKDGSLPQSLVFSTDNAKDIGASAANRPRTGYFGTSVVAPTVNVPDDVSGMFLLGRFTSAIPQSFIFMSTLATDLRVRDQNLTDWMRLTATSLVLPGALTIGSYANVTLTAPAASILEQRNGANAQTFRLYNTYTDAANYERGFVRWSSTVFEVGTESSGTGAARIMRIRSASSIYLNSGGNDYWVLSNSQGGAIAPVSDNALDLGLSNFRVRSGYFGTGVSTPVVLFPATQVPSSDPNALDDYEEGTFTPAVAFGGAAVGVTYLVQNAEYTKIGRLVHFRLRVQLSAKGSSVGNLTIEGLPFAAGGAAAFAYSVYANQLAGVSGHVSAITVPGATNISLRYLGTGGSATVLQDTNMGSSTDLYVTGTYTV